MPLIGIRYDLRRPDWVTRPAAEYYQACLEQCRWADRAGVDSIIISEHHGTDDHYMSSPMTLAAAIAGTTQRPMITIAALLLPFHDPIRLAETMIAIDHIAPGRLVTVLGTGYRQPEFDMAGFAFGDRWERFEEGVRALRSAFGGEPFEYQGRTVVVTPPPVTPGGPMLLMGGNTTKAARRAARLRIGFFAADDNDELAEAYADEAASVGFTEGFAQVPAPLGFIHVSDDPERDWERIMPHAMHEATVYGSWQRPGQHSAVSVDGEVTPEALRAGTIYQVLTPEQCIEMWNTMPAHHTMLLHPMMGGIDPDLAWEGLERFQRDVLPKIRPDSVGADTGNRGS